jgi:hypothetical protein
MDSSLDTFSNDALQKILQFNAKLKEQTERMEKNYNEATKKLLIMNKFYNKKEYK